MGVKVGLLPIGRTQIEGCQKERSRGEYFGTKERKRKNEKTAQ
jgi:hypothetical protein